MYLFHVSNLLPTKNEEPGEGSLGFLTNSVAHIPQYENGKIERWERKINTKDVQHPVKSQIYRRIFVEDNTHDLSSRIFLLEDIKKSSLSVEKHRLKF